MGRAVGPERQGPRLGLMGQGAPVVLMYLVEPVKPCAARCTHNAGSASAID